MSALQIRPPIRTAPTFLANASDSMPCWWTPWRAGTPDERAAVRTDRRPEARCAALQLPASRIVDDSYYAKILPTLDRQLGLARLRLARFLNAGGQAVRGPMRRGCSTSTGGRITMAASGAGHLCHRSFLLKVDQGTAEAHFFFLSDSNSILLGSPVAASLAASWNLRIAARVAGPTVP